MIISFSGEPMLLSPAVLMRGGRTITGWVGGEVEDALRFAVVTGVRPMIETFPLEQAPLAYERMMAAKVHFRAVLEIGRTT